MSDGIAPRTITVHLFGGPHVCRDGGWLSVPEGSKRLLAFMALRRGRVERPYVAGALWPGCREARAAGNLRSALWRLRGAGIDVLECDKWSLRLLDRVTVDVHELKSWADRVISGRLAPGDLSPGHLDADALDLLPGWYDDWTILERERLRQRMLHALEALSRALSEDGRHADAVDAALAAITAEPLRESAQRTLIEAHLAEDNWAEADRVLRGYATLLDNELGVAPSRDLLSLVEYARRRAQRGERVLPAARG